MVCTSIITSKSTKAYITTKYNCPHFKPGKQITYSAVRHFMLVDLIIWSRKSFSS